MTLDVTMHVRGSGRKPSARRRGSRQDHPIRRRGRTLALAGILSTAIVVAAVFLVYNYITPMTPTVVYVIIPAGAGENLHLGFEPAKIKVMIGVNNTIVWKNEDSDWHTAHSNIPEFNSGLIQAGDSFSHTFLRAGVYPYHCDPHPWMTGVVTVVGTSTTIGYAARLPLSGANLQTSTQTEPVKPVFDAS